MLGKANVNNVREHCCFQMVPLKESMGRSTSQSCHNKQRQLQQKNDFLSVPPWEDLQVDASELRPQHCLMTGQSFSWKICGDLEWIGVLKRRVYQVKQMDSTTLYRCLHDAEEYKNAIEAKRTQREALAEFFNLHISLAPLYRKWKVSNPSMMNILEHLKGTRAVHMIVLWPSSYYTVLRIPLNAFFLSFVLQITILHGSPYGAINYGKWNKISENVGKISILVDRLRSEWGEFLTETHSPLLPRLKGAALQEWKERMSHSMNSFNNEKKKCVASTHGEKCDLMATDSDFSTAQSDILKAQFVSSQINVRKKRKITGVSVKKEDMEASPMLPSSYKWYAFPTLEVLVSIEESRLRELGRVTEKSKCMSKKVSESHLFKKKDELEIDLELVQSILQKCNLSL
ncbi:8-oxoguanine Dna glycosylase, N-terminal domain-containing protein [Cardiosporidium cionae]|uniref:8-oxoguanine Dna glycosylase, N-terminal domain-containing protein n=1 Tax=Cardiosporidium cionae TaxID=476202 RepID=A0ABQ7J9J5_9APIC|nr:8-oxoguanine Dna glycosylase, N-terminal domain-containing protein [Cardiosporidium cionae]|eukprot:KAF8820686.1 8-oxoguanine Dna glycosylase, N-terminal domain-containing protein [Cardiosporidium cionae]